MPKKSSSKKLKKQPVKKARRLVKAKAKIKAKAKAKVKPAAKAGKSGKPKKGAKAKVAKAVKKGAKPAKAARASKKVKKPVYLKARKPQKAQKQDVSRLLKAAKEDARVEKKGKGKAAEEAAEPIIAAAGGEDKKIPEQLAQQAVPAAEEEKTPEPQAELAVPNDPLAGTADMGVVYPRGIVEEMEASYLDYAMSVIIQRALPDARDGLKPVQRRILYTMYELGLTHVAKFRKCAKITGDTTGNYHPHGTAAVYESLARLAQDYSLREPLVDGQGNFGSIDGDAPAAERYTEARMTALAEEMLLDIKKETVNFIDNYEATRQEPVVLPTRVPNLLLNGTVGIAVGMATTVLPHNLGELVDATIHIIDHPDCEVMDLFEFIQGPDFPTGASIHGIKDVQEGYLTGRGKALVRAEAKIEERKGGRYDIVITEIPYMVNKATMIERIAQLVKIKRIVGISDIRDESDRDGLRVVIELKKDAFPRKILNQLYQLTPLQEALHMNMIALVDGIQPRLLNIKELLQQFLKHREEVITRRSRHELRLAKERAHILEGLKIALDHIDAIISTIRSSDNREVAHTNLVKKFKLSSEQAEAILMMRLQALAGLERKRIDDEYKEKLALVAELESILGDRKRVLKIIKAELAELKEKFATPRRTRIVKKSLKGFSDEDLIPNQPMVVTLTRGNYLKRVSPSVYRSQRRGGVGVSGMATKEEDIVQHVLITNTHNEALFFTNRGRVFKLKVYEIVQASRQSKGQPIVNLLQLMPDEVVTAMVDWEAEKEDGYLIMVTTQGTVKKTALKDFAHVRPSGLIAIKLSDDDVLEWVAMTSSKDDVFLLSQNGQSIRFPEDNVRPMGRATQGVRGMRLKGDDRIVGMLVFPRGADSRVIVLSENGYGKCTKVGLFKVQHRGGSGVKASSVTAKTGKLVGAALIGEQAQEDLIVMSGKGVIIRMAARSIPTLGRATQGVRLMRMRDNDKVGSFTLYNEAAMARLQAADEGLHGKGDVQPEAIAAAEVVEEAKQPAPVPSRKGKAAKAVKAAKKRAG